MKNKILFITSEFPPLPGGIGNHAHNLADQLSINGYGVTVIADQRSLIRKEELDFDKNLKFEVLRTKLQKPRFFMYIKRIVNAFAQVHNTDIVLCSGKFSLWLGALMSFFYAKKFIAIVHGSELNLNNSLANKATQLAINRFKKVIAVSNYTKSLISNVKEFKTVVIPNGYNSKLWRKNISDKRLTSQYPKLVTVGNVNRRKGQLNVIKHMPMLIKEYPNIHYHCVGLPTMAEQFNLAAIHNGVDKHITFHGRLDQIQMIELVGDCDIFIMLSSATKKGDIEGFGIAIIEANALGIPAIGSKFCGIEDAISNYNSGILIDGTSTEEFHDAVRTILNNDDFEENALRWAQIHTWDSIIKQYIKVIEN